MPDTVGTLISPRSLPVYDLILKDEMVIGTFQRCDIKGPLVIPAGVTLGIIGGGQMTIASDSYLRL